MSESVDFQLLFLGQPNLDQEITDVDPLVSLQLQHLSILGVLHHRTIAGKLLGGGGVGERLNQQEVGFT